MIRTRISDLPHQGVSRSFVGADYGGASVSVYFVEAEGGRGPGPHTHPYVEVAIVQSGRARWTVGEQTFDAVPGDIVVVEAGEVHAFEAVGDAPLVQIDLHLGPHFVQHDLLGEMVVPLAQRNEGNQPRMRQ